MKALFINQQKRIQLPTHNYKRISSSLITFSLATTCAAIMLSLLISAGLHTT